MLVFVFVVVMVELVVVSLLRAFVLVTVHPQSSLHARLVPRVLNSYIKLKNTSGTYRYYGVVVNGSHQVVTRHSK